MLRAEGFYAEKAMKIRVWAIHHVLIAQKVAIPSIPKLKLKKLRKLTNPKLRKLRKFF